MLKHFTILEVDNDECPMMGTIDNIPNNPQGIYNFKDRFLKAIGEHFDVNDYEVSDLPDLFAGSPYEDVEVKIDGVPYKVRIVETWML